MIPLCQEVWIQESTEDIAIKTLDLVIDSGDLGTEQTEEMLADLERHLASRTPLHRAFPNEKRFLLKNAATWIQDGSAMLTSTGQKDQTLKGMTAIYRHGGLLLKDAALVERYEDELGAIAAKPFLQAQPAVEQWKKRVDAEPVWALITHLGLPSGSVGIKYEAEILAAFSTAKLGLGCHLHRRKLGAYPEKLSDLVDKFPAHFKELPADPFTGKPFLYKRTESGCIVWGVGEDRADDGGDAKKDIVFELKK